MPEEKESLEMLRSASKLWKRYLSEYNIQILNSSTMPNVTNGNLILAGHNGASYISFFKNLHKLNINDKVYLYYNGVKYEYLISKYYDTNKDGNVEI